MCFTARTRWAIRVFFIPILPAIIFLQQPSRFLQPALWCLKHSDREFLPAYLCNARGEACDQHFCFYSCIVNACGSVVSTEAWNCCQRLFLYREYFDSTFCKVVPLNREKDVTSSICDTPSRCVRCPVRTGLDGSAGSRFVHVIEKECNRLKLK